MFKSKQGNYDTDVVHFGVYRGMFCFSMISVSGVLLSTSSSYFQMHNGTYPVAFNVYLPHSTCDRTAWVEAYIFMNVKFFLTGSVVSIEAQSVTTEPIFPFLAD